MARFMLNPRRSPRLPARCQVEVSFGRGTMRAETADIGPRGCALASPWPLPVRTPVRLVITSSRLTANLSVQGRVIWASRTAPFRMGIALAQRVSAGPDPGTWFERLLEVHPEMRAALNRVPERLPFEQMLYLGEPPKEAVAFSDEDLALLRLVGAGATIAALQASQGKSDSTRFALFALLARGFLTLSPGDAVPVSRWNWVLARAEISCAAPSPRQADPDLELLLTPLADLADPSAPAAGSPPGPAIDLEAPSAPDKTAQPPPIAAWPPPLRPRGPAAQVLFEQARAATAARDVSDAIAMLRRAQALSPHDPEISALLGQLAFGNRRG